MYSFLVLDLDHWVNWSTVFFFLSLLSLSFSLECCGNRPLILFSFYRWIAVVIVRLSHKTIVLLEFSFPGWRRSASAHLRRSMIVHSRFSLRFFFSHPLQHACYVYMPAVKFLEQQDRRLVIKTKAHTALSSVASKSIVWLWGGFFTTCLPVRL